MSGARVLAAIASVERRAHILPKALASLRPHVDVLAVYLNGYRETPAAVAKLADIIIRDDENRGAERKFHWATEHDGIYLTCDDDFAYPADYVPTMVAAVKRWGGKAIVTAHGREYRGDPKAFHGFVRQRLGTVFHEVKRGYWVNHPGTGVMAWDTRTVPIPSEWPERNISDMQVAVWAQRNGVPIWLIPHRRGWLESFATLDPQGIFRTSQAEKHARRNALLQQVEWKLNTIDP